MGYFVRFESAQGVLWLNLERVCSLAYDEGAKKLRLNYDTAYQELTGVEPGSVVTLEQQIVKFNLVSNRH